VIETDKVEVIATRQLQADTLQCLVRNCKSKRKRNSESDGQRRSDSDAPVAGKYSAVIETDKDKGITTRQLQGNTLLWTMSLVTNWKSQRKRNSYGPTMTKVPFGTFRASRIICL
jgi:hypothetical protein